MVDLERALEAALGLLVQRISGSLDSMDVNLSKLRKIMKGRKPGELQSMEVQSQTRLSSLNVWFNALPRPFPQTPPLYKAPPTPGHAPVQPLPVYSGPPLLAQARGPHL